MPPRGRGFAALRPTLCASLLLAALLSLLPRLALAAAQYELAARIPMTHGAAQGAVWLDSDNYLTLEVTADKVVVYRTSYSSPSRSEFLSDDFMQRHICGPEDAGHLSWKLSPGRRYLYFGWREDTEDRGWALLDIADAPRLRLKRFDPPPGMEFDDVLFSPDDQFAVFRHDYSIEGSEASLLVMDLREGREVWRISSGELGFIDRMWWSSAIYDHPRFNALAMLHEQEFLDKSGLAVCDVRDQEIRFNPESSGVLMGAEALWGKVSCHDSGQGGEQPFMLVATVPGQSGDKVIPLSSSPSALQILPEPGLVLISNSENGGPDQLWLVNVLSGDKQAVDRDCAEFSVASDGKLLVRGQATNEVRIYELAP